MSAAFWPRQAAPRTSLRFSATFVALVTAYLLSGCTGRIADDGYEPGGGSVGPNGSRNGGRSGSAGSGGVAIGGGGSGGGPIAACNGQPRVGPAPLRRLTPSQFRSTVRDLFRADDLPAVTLAADQVVKTFGFDDNADVQTPSALLVSQWQDAAVTLTAAAFQHADKFLPCAPKSSADEAACGKQIVTAFGQRAFRRPLTTDEQTQFSTFFEQARATDNFQVAAQLTVQAMLQSPAFLYVPEFGGSKQADGSLALTPWEIASRLSYLVWNSMPDDELFTAAAGGKLPEPTQLEGQVRRMLRDPKARAAVDELHAQWLGYRALDAIAKDKTTFPMWSDSLRAGLRAEAGAAVTDAVFGDNPGYARLLGGKRSFANAALASLYGAGKPSNADGAWIDLDGKTRGGLVTSAWWLASFAHPIQPAPVLRGQFVMAKLLCTPPPPPPPGVNTAVPEQPTAEAKTNRQRLELLHTSPTSCKSCHKLIDGIGFGLEGYDAVGAFRTTDNGAPVDDSGEIAVGSDVDGAFHGGVELAAKLASSSQVKACIATQWLRYGLGRPERDEDACTIASVAKDFAAGGLTAESLLVSLVKQPTFRSRPPVTP